MSIWKERAILTGGAIVSVEVRKYNICGGTLHAFLFFTGFYTRFSLRESKSCTQILRRYGMRYDTMADY